LPTIISIVLSILAFSFLVFIHELGHFFFAKKFGVKVHEFAIGFPPRIFAKKIGDTTYSINAIPIGGYVKMFGEDSHNEKALKNKNSFLTKSVRQRILIVIGGVLMNFITAFLLFSFGFFVGMPPIIPDKDHPIIYETSNYLSVKKIDPNSNFANEIQANDQIVKINDQAIEQIANPEKLLTQNFTEVKSITFFSNQKTKEIKTNNQEIQGLEFHTFIKDFPRLQILSLNQELLNPPNALRPKDIILQINEFQITQLEEYQKAVKQGEINTFKILRNNKAINKEIKINNPETIAISQVIKDSPAEKAGLQTGDLIKSINNQITQNPAQISELIRNSKNTISLEIIRENEELSFEIKTAENKTIGILMTPVLSQFQNPISLYKTQIPTSITHMENQSFPLSQIPGKSLNLMKDLSLITIKGFTYTLTSFITKFTVPEEVGGIIVVGQEINRQIQTSAINGLQFIAYISLMLGVINILPIPALDGGRLFFLIFEGIVGRRISPKYESYIHGLGFLFLLSLMAIITWKDLVRAFF
jgi:regulator of sigma E protease